MTYFNLHLTSNVNIFKYSFFQSFLDKKYKIGLKKIEGTLEFNNITYTNNRFIYKKVKPILNNNAVIDDFTMIDIPDGNYDLKELYDEINKGLPKEDKSFFKMKLNEENKVILTINKDYKIDFRSPNTLNNVLGFDAKTYNEGINTAPNTFLKHNYENIFLTCNLIEDSYFNESKQNFIHRFNQENIRDEPYNIDYYKVIKRPDEIVLKITDAYNNTIDYSDINIYVKLVLEEF